MYGRVDEVPGLFYVATKFGHILRIPVIPLGSHIVVDEAKDGWRGMPIGLSWKSVLAAYLRGLFMGVGVLLMVAGGIGYFSSASGAGGAALASRLFGFGTVSVAIGLISCMLWARPTKARFEQLCAQLGIDPHEPLEAAEELGEPASEAQTRLRGQENVSGDWRKSKAPPVLKDDPKPYARKS